MRVEMRAFGGAVLATIIGHDPTRPEGTALLLRGDSPEYAAAQVEALRAARVSALKAELRSKVQAARELKARIVALGGE